MDSESKRSRGDNLNWHPIASSTDLTARHVYHGQLLGRELAVWRADDGNVNAWENRCLHRGVRLSIGVNDGRELVCQYHGWRYANRTAGCTYIPAHPADSPARTICNNRYPVVEKYGLVWSTEAAIPVTNQSSTEQSSTEHSTTIPVIDKASNNSLIDDDNLLVLRPLPINATADVISNLLQSYRCVHPLLDEKLHCNLQQKDAYQFTSQIPTTGTTTGKSTYTAADHSTTHSTTHSTARDHPIQLTFFIQPVDSARSVIRGVMSSRSKLSQTTAWLRAHNTALSQLRTVAEQHMLSIEAPAPWEVSITPVSESIAKMPEISSANAASQRAVVRGITDLTSDIQSIELTPVTGDLATSQPGSHIDLLLPNGLIRQYSLTNGPGQTDHYTIGVKRETDSTGGSSFIHDSLNVGDVLGVSAPRNNFPLRRDAVKTLLIAGGIGITPLLSMAKTLAHSNLPFELHYFVASAGDIAYQKDLDLFQTASNRAIAKIHTGLDPTATATCLRQLLTNYQQAHHVYLCGPPPMLDSAKAIAAESSWPDDAVHFEYFKNTNTVSQDKPFTVSLARTGITVTVPSGETLLSVLRKNDVSLPSSCEQGACGTCIVDVIDGTPLHQDVYLSNAERKRGNCMMTCVSRAQSDSLTLDI